MGVYIKNMTFPKSCSVCDFKSVMGYCRRMPPEFYGCTRNEGRPDWCHLVEVKEPHGDLADVSEVKKCLHDLPDSEDKWGAIALLEWAMEKRIVIEAEGQEE